MSGFVPTHRVKQELSGLRSVDVQTDGKRFGVIFFNGEDETRILLSSEAMSALVNSYAPLTNARGELIAYRWTVCREHVVERAKHIAGLASAIEARSGETHASLSCTVANCYLCERDARGSVADDSAAIAQPHPKGQTRSNKSRPVT